MEIKVGYETYLKNIFSDLPATMFIKDKEGKYIYTTKICEWINGGPEHSILGKTDLDIQFEKEIGARYWREDLEILEKGISTHTIDRFENELGYAYIEVLKNPIRDGEGNIIGICGVCNDVTELMELKQKYEMLCVYDTMTGVYNRNYVLKHNLSHNVYLPCSYIMCDCNRLKKVNDTLGHAAGDEYIRNVVLLLKRTFGEESVIVRWGGDEFLIITPHCDGERQNRLITAIYDHQKELQKEYPYLDLAIGGMIRETLSKSEEMCIREADQRMYEVKYKTR